MIDFVKKHIDNGLLNSGNISFKKIRSIAGINYGDDTWVKLGRGKNTLQSQEELNQYLYSYGKMIESQWVNFFGLIPLSFGSNKLSIYDYGCGQALGSIMLMDHRKIEKKNLLNVSLIEPSPVALDRAKDIMTCYCEKDARIDTINKKIDDLGGIYSGNNYDKIHLFSNVLDIASFDHLSLCDSIVSEKGVHYILAVSHDRDHNGGSGRLHGFYNKIVSNKFVKLLESSLHTFTCNNNNPAIAFYIKIEV